jgi:lysophospholipase L1-like esterase
MKRVVCFGDSNTWGYDPATGKRMDRDVRWTGVLRNALGPSYEVIEEGLNGRTTVWNDPIEGYKNGHDYLIPCLETHRPFDLIIIMLGSNDLKKRFSVSAYDIAKGAGVLVDVVQKSDAGIDGAAPKVLLAAPPPVAKLTGYAEMFEGSEPKSRKFGEHFKNIAALMGCAFLDASTAVVSSDLDGIHLEKGEHFKLGQVMAAKVKQLIG